MIEGVKESKTITSIAVSDYIAHFNRMGKRIPDEEIKFFSLCQKNAVDKFGQLIASSTPSSNRYLINDILESSGIGDLDRWRMNPTRWIMVVTVMLISVIMTAANSPKAKIAGWTIFSLASMLGITLSYKNIKNKISLSVEIIP